MSSKAHALVCTSVRPAGRRSRMPCVASLLAVVLGAALALPSVASAAGKLYRWSEPDGALTFSPTPPDDGTPYDEVDPLTMQKPVVAINQPARASTATASDAAATSKPALDGRVPIDLTGDTSDTASSATPAMGAAMIERAQPAAEPAADISPEIASGEAAAQASAASSARTKNQRCNELRKRVTSLEQRLASPLTPEAMDNTVVHMARYQQSFERHCG